MQAGREGEMGGVLGASGWGAGIGLCPPTPGRPACASLCSTPLLLGKLRRREGGLPVPKVSSQPKGLACM